MKSHKFSVAYKNVTQVNNCYPPKSAFVKHLFKFVFINATAKR